jgi:hypothetical protein
LRKSAPANSHDICGTFRRGRFSVALKRVLAYISLSSARSKGEELVDTVFGFILAGVGFGTTFLVLLIISLLCEILKKIFPHPEEDSKC